MDIIFNEKFSSAFVTFLSKSVFVVGGRD